MTGGLLHHSNFFWFCCCAVVSGSTSLVMIRLARHFYCYNGTVRKFSIMQLEFPAHTSSITALVKNIRAMPSDGGYESLKALRAQLQIDFLYMAGTYTGIYFLSRIVAIWFAGWPAACIIVLGNLQFLAWLFDIIENTYLLVQIRNPSEMSVTEFFLYRMMELLKWGLALGTGAAVLIMIVIHYLKIWK